RQRPGSPRVLEGPSGDLLHPGDGFFERRVGEEPLARRVVTREARLLGQHRLAARQVAEAPIADPTAATLDVYVFRDGKLFERASDVTPVGERVAGDHLGIDQRPSLVR